MIHPLVWMAATCQCHRLCNTVRLFFRDAARIRPEIFLTLFCPMYYFLIWYMGSWRRTWMGCEGCSCVQCHFQKLPLKAPQQNCGVWYTIHVCILRMIVHVCEDLCFCVSLILWWKKTQWGASNKRERGWGRWKRKAEGQDSYNKRFIAGGL